MSSRPPGSSTPDPAVARAYVACGYLLGRRGDELLAGLAGATANVPLATALSHPNRTERARVLATALAEVARAVHEQRLL
ncbi:MAG TPA: hypothetical protein VI197_25340 [Polyangiaceae bacterium]